MDKITANITLTCGHSDIYLRSTGNQYRMCSTCKDLRLIKKINN